MQLLERPSRGDEATCEEVEQLGVAGPLAHCPEVAGGGDEASAEVTLPDAVDQDPGGEGIVGAGDRASQLESATPLAKWRRASLRREDREELPGRLGPEGCGVAAEVDPHIGHR